MGSIRGKAHILPDNAHATVSISAGQWNVTCLGSIRRKTHAALPRYTANSEHTNGANAHSRVLRTHTKHSLSIQRGKHTERVLLWILQPSKLATPPPQT